jgi:hypothetical protein
MIMAYESENSGVHSIADFELGLKADTHCK